jgi:ribonucleoside-diphosphate reductase alpha chain
MDVFKALSECVVYDKYAKFIPHLNRRETWPEIIDRYCLALTDRLDEIKNDRKNKNINIPAIESLKEYVMNDVKYYLNEKLIIPSMRALQFAGEPLKKRHNRIYNCAFMHFENVNSFGELAYNLLCGTGVGYSVEKKHLKNKFKKTNENEFNKISFLSVEDSIEGWADSFVFLIEKSLKGNIVEFGYSSISKKGTPLSSGGKSPGPDPLEKSHKKIAEIIAEAPLGVLSSFTIHRIACVIADCVVAGGIRRAALSCLFDNTDEEMLTCKQTSDWYIKYPELARCNNSAVWYREKLKDKVYLRKYKKFLKNLLNSGFGEPGIFLSSNPSMGTNPCFEIALNNKQFCNLVEINVEKYKNFKNKPIASKFPVKAKSLIKAATTIATIQASFTKFKYLKGWDKITEKEALIGVSKTGFISNPSTVCSDHDDFNNHKELVDSINKDVARIIGINPAARTRTIKPSGTASLVLETSPGIHPYYAPFFLRAVRYNKDSAIAKHFINTLGYDSGLVEDDKMSKNTIVVYFPIKVNVARKDTAVELKPENMLNYTFSTYKNWIKTDMDIPFENTNNVSVTVNYDNRNEKEKKEIIKLLIENIENYAAISFLPKSHDYPQAPISEITEDEYNRKSKIFSERYISVVNIKEFEDNVNFDNSISCEGASCEIL